MSTAGDSGTGGDGGGAGESDLRCNASTLLRDVTHVLVASGSAIKVAAVRQALADVIDNKEHSDSIVVSGVKAPSMVSEQPVGHHETRIGARNRAAAALRGAAESDNPQLVVSIENGIINIGEDTWFDVAWVVVQDVSLEPMISIELPSVGLALDSVWVAAAIEGKTESERGTVGALLAEKTGCVGTDPHSMLTLGAFPRESQLVGVLVAAIGQLARRRAERSGKVERIVW